jgi:hypothetical protein
MSVQRDESTPLVNVIGGHGSRRPEFRCRPRREPTPCAYCSHSMGDRGDGTICNPLNLDPARKIEDWAYPVACDRCGGTGWDPDQS